MKIAMFMTPSVLRMFKTGAQFSRMHRGMKKGVKDAIEISADTARGSIGGYSGLKNRSGYLRRSINTYVNSKTTSAVATIGSNAVYAAIHEHGGVVTTKVSNYLMFQTQSGWVKTKLVNIPPRPFLATAVDRNYFTMKQAIIKGINKEISNDLTVRVN